jgi:hypothetical protein
MFALPFFSQNTSVLKEKAKYLFAIMKTTLENREFGHNARSATSRFSFAGSLLKGG